MSYYYDTKNICFERPVNLVRGDLVWVKWHFHRHTNRGEIATPTKILKVYDDGNILHKKRGYDEVEFAFTRDVVAKSPGIPFERMPYRTVEVSIIRERIRVKEAAVPISGELHE